MVSTWLAVTIGVMVGLLFIYIALRVAMNWEGGSVADLAKAIAEACGFCGGNK